MKNKSDTIKGAELLAPPSLSHLCRLGLSNNSGKTLTNLAYPMPQFLIASQSLSWSLISIPRLLNSATTAFQRSYSTKDSLVAVSIFYHFLSNAVKVRPEAFASTLILPLVYFCPCLRTKTGIVDFKKSLKNLSSRFLRLMPRNVEIQVQSNFNFRLFIHKNFNASDYISFAHLNSK